MHSLYFAFSVLPGPKLAERFRKNTVLIFDFTINNKMFVHIHLLSNSTACVIIFYYFFNNKTHFMYCLFSCSAITKNMRIVAVVSPLEVNLLFAVLVFGSVFVTSAKKIPHLSNVTQTAKLQTH